MKSVTDRIKEIETKIESINEVYKSILAIHTQIDRKKQDLELQVLHLNTQKTNLLNGQLDFDMGSSF